MKTTYPDKWLRIIVIPPLAVFIRHFGVSEPFFDLLQTNSYYIEIARNLIIIALVWETNRFIISMLDTRYSWITSRTKRLLVQTSLTFSASTVEVLLFLYTFGTIQYGFATSHQAPFSIQSFFIREFPLTLVCVAILQLAYLAMYLLRFHHYSVRRLNEQLDEALRVAERLKLDKIYNELNETFPDYYQDHLIVNYGPASVPVQTDNIAYIFSIMDRSFVKTLDGSEYSCHSSLEKLELLVNPVRFFRINREILASVRAIKEFRQDASGKLSVELFPSFHEEVLVNRKKAQEFKEWFGKKI